MYRTSASGRFVLAPTILLLLTALLTLSGQRALAQAPGSSARERQRFAAGWENGTPAVVTGEVRVFHTDDVANKRATDAYTIRDERSGRSFQLRFEQSTPNTVRAGQKVRVTGRSLGSDLYVAACCDSATSNVETLSEAVASPSGDQRALVMIADLLDATVSCTVDYVRDTLFAPPTGTFDADGTGLSVNAEYRDNSSGAVSWSGQVVRTTLNINSTDACTLDQYSRTLDAQAAALGVYVPSYPRKMYVFPPMSQCPFVGASTQGGTPTSSFSFSCSNRGLYSHELGHALGMSHAAAYYDAYTAGAGGFSNRLDQYGDYSDSMGTSGLQFHGFNAPHREQMGWIPVGATQVVTQSGQYDLAPLSLQPWAGSTPQVIKIPRQEGGYYYLSYRGGQTFERYIPSYATRVSVHRYGSPSDASSGFTFLYATLANGRVGEDTFRDAGNGITVTMRSGYGTAPGFGATVDIEIAAPCARAAPSLAMSPQSQSGPAGGNSTYTLSLTNNDAPSCPAATFALSRTAPVGWSATLSTPELTVAPGNSAQATLMVASPSTIEAGAYTATVNTSDAAAPVHTALSNVMYMVLDAAPPSTPVNLTATALTKSKQVKLSWGAASDNIGVAAYFVFRNGSVVGTSTTTSWTDTAWVRGATYSYSVVATDAAGNTSTPSNAATVTLSAGGKTR